MLQPGYHILNREFPRILFVILADFFTDSRLFRRHTDCKGTMEPGHVSIEELEKMVIMGSGPGIESLSNPMSMLFKLQC